MSDTIDTIEAVIFDLDGTLADSLNDIGLAMNAVLEELRLPPHPMSAYGQFVGEGAEHLVRRAVHAASGRDAREPNDALLPAALGDLVVRYRAHYLDLHHANSVPYPGVPELLRALVQKGLKLAVLSNKRDDFTKLLVRQRFSQVPFVDVRGERDGVPRKPDPTAALEMARSINVRPSAVAFIGDTAIDMGTARNAGMHPVGVLWGFRDRQELEAAGAEHLIAEPGELLAVLPRLCAKVHAGTSGSFG
jgi:phosphoglycolate phosphatase